VLALVLEQIASPMELKGENTWSALAPRLKRCRAAGRAD
jgi:hypothetical protein